MVTKMIDGKEWKGSGTRHYSKADAMKIQSICKERGVRARLLKFNYGNGDIFWLVFIDSYQEWLYDVDKAWME